MGGIGGIGGMGGLGGMGGIGGIGGLGVVGGMGGIGGGYGGAGNIATATGLQGFNAGTTFNGIFCYQTRHTTWRAVYSEYTTTAGQVLLDTSQAQVPNSEPTGSQALTDLIVRKGANGSVTYLLPRSRFSLIGYQSNINYQSNGTQDTLGLTAFWDWRFARRTSAQMIFSWQSSDNRPASSPKYSSDYYLVSVGAYHRVSDYLGGSLTYRYSKQDSDLATARFQENRVMASVFIRF